MTMLHPAQYQHAQINRLSLRVYRAAWAVVAELGGAVVVCGNAGCGRALVVRVGGRKRLEAFADRRGWALNPQWTSTLCPDHWRTS